MTCRGTPPYIHRDLHDGLNGNADRRNVSVREFGWDREKKKEALLLVDKKKEKKKEPLNSSLTDGELSRRNRCMIGPFKIRTYMAVRCALQSYLRIAICHHDEWLHPLAHI